MLKAWFSPRWRVLILLVAVNAAWMACAWEWSSRNSWLWITPFALSINFLLLTYDQVLSFAPAQAQPLTGSDPYGLLKIVNDLCAKLAAPKPKVFFLPQPSAQIFTYGKRRASQRLYVTEGALHLLSPSELEAVLTFQILVMKSSLGQLNYWLAALVDLESRVGQLLEKAFAFVFGWTPPLAGALVSPWLFLLQSLLISRHDFQALDEATAAHLTNARILAEALWKLDAYSQTRPWPEPWIFAHMCMVSPLKMKSFLSPLRIQPPLRQRLKGLIGEERL